MMFVDNHKLWRLYQNTQVQPNFSYYHGMFYFQWSLRFCLLVCCASFLVPGGAFISCQLWCMRKGLLSTKQHDKKPDSTPVPKKRVKWLKIFMDDSMHYFLYSTKKQLTSRQNYIDVIGKAVVLAQLLILALLGCYGPIVSVISINFFFFMYFCK